MRALVTGCAGFIGSHLTESLLADGCDVVGVDCFNDNYARPEKLRNIERAREWDRFDFVPVDLARGDLVSFTRECDAVFHLAGEPGVRTSWGSRFETYVRNNVLATQHLLDALLDAPGARLVFASSSSVYGEAEELPVTETALPRPHSPYGVTKLAAEHLCGLYARNHGIDVVSLRYFSVYGPRQRPDMALERFCRAAVGGGLIELYGDGTQTRDFTYVADIVAATRAAAERPGLDGIFNIGAGGRVRLIDALALLSELSGRDLEPVVEPGMKGDVTDTAADITRATSELGWEPQTDFAAGIAAQFETVRALTAS